MAAQLAAVAVLLTAAGLFVRTFTALLRLDLGFDPRGVLTFNLGFPEEKYDHEREAVGGVVGDMTFPSLEGTAVEERKVRHVFSTLLQKPDLGEIRIHDLRHPYATLLLQAGAPITYVSQQLGHRDASITLREYAHYPHRVRTGRRSA